MKIASLISGGKDSLCALEWGIKNHDVRVLISIKTQDSESYMWHIPCQKWVKLQAEAVGIPLIEIESSNPEDELEELKNLLKKLKKEKNIQGLTTGAIESVYQKSRIDKICKQVGIESFSPLWKTNSKNKLKELIDSGYKIMIVGVAAEGLTKDFLGKIIDNEIYNKLIELNKKYKVHIMGEGGEYETFVLDTLFFKKKIKINSSEKIWEHNSGYLIIKDAELVEK